MSAKAQVAVPESNLTLSEIDSNLKELSEVLKRDDLRWETRELVVKRANDWLDRRNLICHL